MAVLSSRIGIPHSWNGGDRIMFENSNDDHSAHKQSFFVGFNPAFIFRHASSVVSYNPT